MPEETLLLVLGVLHAIVALLAGIRVYQCVVRCERELPSEEDV